MCLRLREQLKKQHNRRNAQPDDARRRSRDAAAGWWKHAVMSGTESHEYADRLVSLEGAWWKRLLPVQAPYRWNLRRQHLGRTLDVGCGVGRNLASLDPESVGVDHNAVSVGAARERGHEAYTVEEFLESPVARPGTFDAILLAHVVEHMSRAAALDLLHTYLPFLRPGGRVMLICPQERGFASDPTHETFTTGSDLVRLARDAGLTAEAWRSFPLPRFAGKAFVYNEFTVLASKPG
jgi:SAM-dependent methyltransferase